MSTETSKFLETLMQQHFARLASVANHRTRGMSADAQQEVLAAALLAAWEQRSSFDPKDGEGAVAGVLAGWFDGLVRDAKRAFHKQALPAGAAEKLERLTADENTETQQTLEQFLSTLPPHKQAALKALMHGSSVRQAAAETGLSVPEIKQLKKRLRFHVLSDSLPQATPRRLPRESDDVDYLPNQIDRDIESLDGPRHDGHKDCPVCWRCSWFAKSWSVKLRPSPLADPDIRAAQDAIDRRKVAITGQINTDDSVQHVWISDTVTTVTQQYQEQRA
jgi:RNA polymerase sigma factor (sigma-70 family)